MTRIGRVGHLLATGLVALLILLPASASASVVGWGFNEHAELGAGYKSVPQPVVSTLVSCPVREVQASESAGFVLCENGTVQGWGGNGLGTVGIGTHTKGIVTPVTLPTLRNVKQVAASGDHAMALLANGDVEVWGSNLFGNLGNGTSTHGKEMAGDNVPTPQLVPGLHNVCQIALGGPDNLALLCDGTVEGWGENKTGQLGPPVTFEVTTPKVIAGLSGVKAVAVGAYPAAGGHVLALLNDGTVRALGRNDQGQLGNGSTTNSSTPVTVQGLSEVVQVSADVSHSLALTADGTVHSFGGNTYGQLGVTGPEGCGTSTCARTPIALGLRNVTSISAGFRYSAVIANGLPFGFGLNIRRELGDGTILTRSFPVPVLEVAEATQISAGWYHTLAILKGAGPRPMIEATPGSGMVSLRWRSTGETRPWHVSWRPVTRPASLWSTGTLLPPAARSFTLSGLPSVQIEVSLKDVNYGTRIVTVTPLP